MQMSLSERSKCMQRWH